MDMSKYYTRTAAADRQRDDDGCRARDRSAVILANIGLGAAKRGDIPYKKSLLEYQRYEQVFKIII